MSAEEDRKRKQQEDLPPLPPLLAQILAETRARQQKKALAKEEGGSAADGSDDEAKPASGPLFLEAAPNYLMVAGSAVPENKQYKPPSDSEDDSDAEAEEPPGPLDAARCTAHGPGFSGGAAGQHLKVTITARDSNGRRIREGGAHLLVMVEPAAAAAVAAGKEEEEDSEAIQADIVDHENGTYTASYAVPTKGNYQLHIEANGEPLGDSPYPIFFSAPIPQSEMAPTLPAAAGPGGGPMHHPALPAGISMPVPTITAAGIQIVTAAAIKEAQQQQQAGQQQAEGAAAHAAAAGNNAMASAYPNIGTGMQVSLGAQLAHAGIRFPVLEQEQLNRMVLIGGVTAHATAEALKSVFSFCGNIRSCTLAGAQSGFAFIEFSSAHEAAAAMAMSGVQLMGQALKVEMAAEARRAAEMAANTVSNPFLALQAHQVQQFQLMQQQQTALAEQVLTMRAAQRAGTALALGPNYRSNDSQKSAAIAAALALTKKMAGMGGNGGAAGGSAPANGGARGGNDRKRSRSRDRERSRPRGGGGGGREDERSRRDRSRSRDRRRERERGGGSRERRVNRPSSRERRQQRSPERQRKPRSPEWQRKERSRSPDRQRKAARSRSRERKRSHRSRSREPHKHHHRDHKDKKEERRERRRSRDRDGKRSSKGDKAAEAAADEPQEQQPAEEQPAAAVAAEPMAWEAEADAGAAAVATNKQRQEDKQHAMGKQPPAHDELEALLDELGE